MSEVTQYAVHGGVALIRMDNPPMNTLSNALRAEIMRALDRADSDPSVKAVLIMGSAKVFSAGADLREFAGPYLKPDLREINDRQDAMTKPLVAAIGGLALGGGLELALACHYRVAAPGAQLGLPEVKLGLVPGSGGTQRLPRAIPIAEAVKMMTTGDPITAERAKELGLVNEVVHGDLLEGAIAFARGKIGQPLRRLRDCSVAIDEDPAAFFARARSQVAKKSKGYPAPLLIVECAEVAATLSFDEGIKFESGTFEKLAHGPEAKALRHVFFAERRTAKIPDLPENTPVREISKGAIIGAGTMGAAIAMCFANAGIPVTLVEATQGALARGLGKIRETYATAASKGSLRQRDVDERLSLIRGTVDIHEVADSDIVIEAVFERMDVKQELFRKLDGIVKKGAILATNTSSLDVDEIAAVTGRAPDIVGMHFFSPAHVMRLLEVVRGKHTADDVLATAMKLGKRLKKVPVVSRVCDGFIGNRMLERYGQQALFLLDEGASPCEVDRALQNWGMAMGPFAMYDMAGLDIGWDVRKCRYEERPDIVYSRILDRICELGRFGQKTGKGIYRYEPGRRDPISDPEVDAIIAQYRQKIGVRPRSISDEEIVERCIYALVNEAAYILDEGIALRASDVDVVYVAGYGFPAYRGGPMFYADTVGLPKVLAAIERFQKGYQGHQWKPAPLLVRLAREGKRFNGEE